MIKKNKYLLAVFIALCGIWAACKQQRDLCLTPKIASLVIESMHIISDTGTIFYDTILPAAEFVPLAKPDTLQLVIYPQSSLFTISLSPVSDTCRWLFRADSLGNNARDTLWDTLTFYYKRDLQFLSNACGYTYFYTIDTVLTSHFNIDSLHITNYSVTNDASAKHVQIFIHPDI